jgi:hypothetical protein
MNKTSIFFIIIGLLVLGGALLFLRNSDKPIPPPLVVSVSFKDEPAFAPQLYRAEQGQEVVLKISSDITDRVHLHGYDLYSDAGVGKESVISFTAARTGRFDFELEGSQKKLGVIEVYPR